MANRYWVGGTGTWDTTTTTNWSTSSGGGGGASVPTAADSVLFDQTGTYTVTMTGALACLDFTVSAGTVTFATGTAPTLAISGSMSIIAGTVWTSTGAITFNATTTGKTISTNGVNFGSLIYFDGVGGGWTLNSAFSTSNNFIFIVNGSFSTGSNYTLTTFGIQSSGTATRSISLNASIVNLGDINLNATGLTWNAGTSSIVNNYGGSVYLNGAGQTFWDYSATGTFYSLPITGANTFHNLSFPAWIQNGKQVTFDSNITVTGTLTCPVSGTVVGGYRNFLSSATLGTPITITAAAVSLTDVDFRDIVGAGAASWSGTRLGDCGGNSGITFPAAKTVYMVGTTQTSFQAALFSTISGGSTSTANFPLPQDTAMINNSSISSGQTLTLFAAQYGNLDFSGLTNTIILSTSSVSGSIGFYGNFTGSSSITSGTTAYGINFQNRTAKTFTSAGITFNCPFAINTVAASSLQLLDNVTTTTTTTLTQGTLDLNNKTLTTLTWSSNNSITRSILFGTGKISVNGSGASLFSMAVTTNFSCTGTPTVEINNATATASTVNMTLATETQAFNFNIISGSYALTLTANCKNVNFTGFTGTLANSTRTIYGNLTLVSGMSLTAGITTTTFGATSGTQLITTAAKTFDLPITVNGVGGTVQLQDALTMGSARLFTHTNGTVDLNGKTLTVGSNYTTATGTKNLTFNGGTLVCPAATSTAFNNAAPTGYTTTAGAGGNGTISLTGATIKTFVGGGSTYAATLNQGGAGTLTISGSNTLAGISNSYSATGATTISFTSSTTQTVSSFTATGTAGNVLTLNAVTSGTFASMALSSGIVSTVDYLSVKDLHVTPATTTWYAGANSTNVSGNTGWIFTAAPSISTKGNFFLLMQ